MKSVGNLDRGGRSLPTTFCVSAGAISNDDLHAGVVSKPVGEHLSRTIIEDVDRPVRFEIDQYGAVTTLLSTQCEIVDAQHSWDLHRGIGHGAQQPQERIGADG